MYCYSGSFQLGYGQEDVFNEMIASSGGIVLTLYVNKSGTINWTV